MFQTILVPVDDNPASAKAVETAARLAQPLGGKLLLLHVLEPLPTYTAQVEMHLPRGELERAAGEYGEELLQRFEALVPAGVAHEAHVHHGKGRVWRDILEFADEHGVELIVMGTHGREGVARTLLGSVAERVARHAKVPVMLVR